MKKIKMLGISALSATLMMSSMAAPIFAIDTDVVDEVWGKPTVVYGGGLSENQIEATRELFDIKDTNNVVELTVSGSDVDTYLGYSGVSTSSLISSVMVQKQDEGKGVKVKFINSENITKITSSQYANAAITAGVSDVQIEIASVQKVTGESALSGVYKALEANGETLDTERTEVAQEELETTNEIAENNADNSDFNSDSLDQAIVDIKTELAEIKEEQGETATLDQIKEVVEEALQNYDLSDILSQEDIDKLIAFLEKYQNTSAIDSTEVLNQLQSLSNSLKEQFGNLMDRAQSEGWWDKIVSFFKNLFGIE